MIRFGCVGLLSGVLVLAGCETQARSAHTASAVDSAGISIVTSPDRQSPLLYVDSVPDLSIGGAEAERPAAFGQIENVIVGPDDSIWVSDRQAADVQVFNPDGSHRATVGGRGSGPGEFRVVRLLGSARDSVAIQDARSRQINWYALSGARLGGVQVALTGGTNPLLYDVTWDGRLVGVESQTLTEADFEAGKTYGGTVPFSIWVSPQSPPSVFTSEPTAVFIWSELRVTMAMPFTSTAQLDAEKHIDVVAGPDFEVRRFDSGGALIRIARVEREPSPVDASSRGAYRTFVENAVPPGRREAALDALDHPDLPELAPAYRFVVQGRDGSTWAYRFDAGSPGGQPWDVFLADGTFVGSVTLPDRFQLTAATEEFVYGYWTDDLGVQHVRRHRVIRSES